MHRNRPCRRTGLSGRGYACHNGTFDLGLHAWHEPFDRILALAWERSISITTPQMGEAFNITQPQRGNAWWLGVEGESEGVVQNA